MSESLKLNNAVYGDAPLLSIIIPAYNASDFIEEALESIFRQPINCDLIEVLVINDGSTDDTAEKVSKFKHNDNLKLFNVANGGTGRARNIGINEAKGDFIIFLDADDLLLPNGINDALILELKNYLKDSVDIIYTPKYVSDLNLQKKITVRYPEPIKKIRHHMPLIEFWSSIYRRKYLINNKIYFFEYKEQDIETAFRYRAFSRTIKILADKSIRFYLHRDNPSSNVHTWKPLTVNYVKAKVYCELIGELDKNLLNQDGAYLKYVALNCIYDFFNYVYLNGYLENQREQVNYMIAKDKELKFSVKDWMLIGLKGKVGYFKRKFKIFNFIKSTQIGNSLMCSQEHQYKRNDFKKDTFENIIERWLLIKID